MCCRESESINFRGPSGNFYDVVGHSQPQMEKNEIFFYHLLQDSGLIKEEPERMQEPNQRMEFCVAGSSALKHRLQGRREAYNTPAKAGKTQKGQEINTTYKAQKAAGASRITRSLSGVTV